VKQLADGADVAGFEREHFERLPHDAVQDWADKERVADRQLIAR